MVVRATRWLPIAGVCLAVAALTLTVVLAAARAAAPVEIRIRYSAFEPATVPAQAGRPLTILLRNDDPIDHEWIVGDAASHERHRTGTEPAHGERPTEVTVPAGEVRTTTVTFDSPGTYAFICHLPGHEAFGMVGRVVVTR